MIQSTAAVAAATAGTSIAHQYTVSTPSSLLPSPSSPGNNGVNHPLHPQQLQLQLQQQQRQSYTRSLSSSPSGPAEAEGGGGGGGPIPVIEFPDDEVHFYPFLLHPTSPTIPFFFYVFYLHPWPLPSIVTIQAFQTQTKSRLLLFWLFFIC